MPIKWQDQGVRDRLLAAIIASYEGEINCRKVATMFGPEATYNAIENFLRKPKQQAKALKAEATAEGRQTPAASPSRPRAIKTGGTPKKGDGVKSGRVTKNKKADGSPLKKEMVSDMDVFKTDDGSIDTCGDVAVESEETEFI